MTPRIDYIAIRHVEMARPEGIAFQIYLVCRKTLKTCEKDFRVMPTSFYQRLRRASGSYSLALS